MTWRIRRHILACLVLAFMLFVVYHYFHSLRVISAKVVAIIVPATQPMWREIKVVVVSDFPEYAFIPPAMRRFFRLEPILCFANPGGMELVNEDIQSPCVVSADGYAKKARLHRMAHSEFHIPVNLQASRFNGERRFLRQLRQQGGVWLQFRLGGHIFPPAVEATPVFVDLAAYCRGNVAQCAGLLQ